MKRDRTKLFDMIKYVKESEKTIYPFELIAFFIPSMQELNLLYNKTFKGKYHRITIDLSNRTLKGAIRKAYQLKKEKDYTGEMILGYLKR